jgi:hypothetical protein
MGFEINIFPTNIQLFASYGLYSPIYNFNLSFSDSLIQGELGDWIPCRSTEWQKRSNGQNIRIKFHISELHSSVEISILFLIAKKVHQMRLIQGS